MAVGNIKWYDEKKGYGFIESEEHGDIFFHSSNIENHGFFGLQKSDRVSFEIIETQKGKKADRVKPI
ncbi:MAG: cold shock domain-containing protein [Desulfobacteraceae bacterium]|jgi:CspA family cold shock protein|nr:MAG: cold shock domain-containing protein [Desulfobacteraceae bacterium]